MNHSTAIKTTRESKVIQFSKAFTSSSHQMFLTTHLIPARRPNCVPLFLKDSSLAECAFAIWDVWIVPGALLSLRFVSAFFVLKLLHPSGLLSQMNNVWFMYFSLAKGIISFCFQHSNTYCMMHYLHTTGYSFASRPTGCLSFLWHCKCSHRKIHFALLN